jgi:hypothetical protein
VREHAAATGSLHTTGKDPDHARFRSGETKIDHI